MNATAIAHPNIALVKYWGKRDRRLNLPAVPSLSVTLAPFETRTEVQWGASADCFEINGRLAEGDAADRVATFLDLVDPNRPPVRIISTNNFPTAAGLASSSSAFAALALAALPHAGAGAGDVEKLHFLIPGGAGGGWDGTARGTGEALTKSGMLKSASYENMSGGGGGKAIAHIIETKDLAVFA